jgi:hypothetical protein
MKIKHFICALALTVTCAGLSLPTYAAPDVSHTPIVHVPKAEPIDKVLAKPGNEMFRAKMQWIAEAPKHKVSNVYMSLVMDENMLNKIKDEENLVYDITELVDECFVGSNIKTIPYVALRNNARNNRELMQMMQARDTGITLVVDKQDKGEVILRGYLEDPATQTSYANYISRCLYDKKDGYIGKKEAFQKALRGFVNEIKAYNNGEVKI